MNSDPWLTGQSPAPAPTGDGAPRELETCWRCERDPAVTRCRICNRPLCGDCRIDHYHEGWQ